MLIKTLELASLSIGAPLLGNMEGRSFLRVYETKRYFMLYIYIYLYMPCKRVSMSIGAPMGNLKEIRLPGSS